MRQIDGANFAKLIEMVAKVFLCDRFVHDPTHVKSCDAESMKDKNANIRWVQIREQIRAQR